MSTIPELTKHARELMHKNRSYIFFREATELSSKDGPIGGAGVPLTPGRSIAVVTEPASTVMLADADAIVGNTTPNSTQIAFTTKMNRPSVISVNGSVRTSRTGRIRRR